MATGRNSRTLVFSWQVRLAEAGPMTAAHGLTTVEGGAEANPEREGGRHFEPGAACAPHLRVVMERLPGFRWPVIRHLTGDGILEPQSRGGPLITLVKSRVGHAFAAIVIEGFSVV